MYVCRYVCIYIYILYIMCVSVSFISLSLLILNTHGYARVQTAWGDDLRRGAALPVRHREPESHSGKGPSALSPREPS